MRWGDISTGFGSQNGEEILLHRLAARQHATVLPLSSALPEEETDAVAVASLALA
jgi:hypothetical protein